MDFIPVEMEHQILSYLAFDELFQYRTVSKHWNHVIINVIRDYYCQKMTTIHFAKIFKNEYGQKLIDDLFDKLLDHQKTKLCELYAAYGNIDGVQKCLEHGAVITYKAVYYAKAHSHEIIVERYYDQMSCIDVDESIDHTGKNNSCHLLMKHAIMIGNEMPNYKSEIKSQYESIMKTINSGRILGYKWLYCDHTLNLSLVKYIAKHNINFFRNIKNPSILYDILQASLTIKNINVELIQILNNMGEFITKCVSKMRYQTKNFRVVKWLYDNKFYPKEELHWKLFNDNLLWQNLIRKHHDKPPMTDLSIWLYNDFPLYRNKIMDIAIGNGDIDFLEYIRSVDNYYLMSKWENLMSVAISLDRSKIVKWLIKHWNSETSLTTVNIGLCNVYRYKKSYFNGKTIPYQRINSKSYLLFKQFIDQIDSTIFDQIVEKSKRNGTGLI